MEIINRELINFKDRKFPDKVLDLKPYVPQFDNIITNKVGWLQGKVKRKVS